MFAVLTPGTTGGLAGLSVSYALQVSTLFSFKYFWYPVWKYSVNWPQHDKTNKMSVRPAKTQISLGIRPAWSESLLCTQWVAKDPMFLHADSEDWSDWVEAQADLSLCWAHTHFVGFVMSRLKYRVQKHVMSGECRGGSHLENSVSSTIVFAVHVLWYRDTN